MTLRLTPKQYRTLMKMAWISSRVAQGSELEDSDTVTQILDLTDTLCQSAADFESEDMFETIPPEEESVEEDFRVGSQSLRLREDIEDELIAIMEWYDEYCFWDVLEDRMAMRDISEERTEAQWNWLPDAEKDRIYEKYLDFYFEEFSDFGISNLRLVPRDPAKPVLPWSWDNEQESAPPREKASHSRSGKIIDFPGRTGKAAKAKTGIGSSKDPSDPSDDGPGKG